MVVVDDEKMKNECKIPSVKMQNAKDERIDSNFESGEELVGVR